MPLINRPEIIRHESLISYLRRLGIANYYEEPAWYLAFLSTPIKDPINLIRRKEHYETLASLIGTDEETIYSMTFHSFKDFYPNDFGHIPQQNEVTISRPLWSKSRDSEHYRGYITGKICPLCWAQHKALLTPWHLVDVTACPVHHILLVDICPYCNQPLHFSPTYEDCNQCQTPISEFPLTQIRDDLLSMTLNLWTWQAIDAKEIPEPNNITIQLTNGSKLYFHRRFMLHIIRWIADFLIRFEKDRFIRRNPILEPYTTNYRINFRKTPNVIIHSLYLVCCEFLLEWPSSFQLLLNKNLANWLLDPHINNTNTRDIPSDLLDEVDRDEWQWLQETLIAHLDELSLHFKKVHPWKETYEALLAPPTARKLLSSIKVSLYAARMNCDKDEVVTFCERTLGISVQAFNIKLKHRTIDTRSCLNCDESSIIRSIWYRHFTRNLPSASIKDALLHQMTTIHTSLPDDESECNKLLEAILHPFGISCPRCGSREHRSCGISGGHKRYRCLSCNRTYNIFSGTLPGTIKGPPSKRLRILKSFLTCLNLPLCGNVHKPKPTEIQSHE